MSATVPTTEPTEIRAGDTIKWRREDLQSDYPASTWTLRYRAKSVTSGLDILATADGNAFAITIAAADSALFVAGTYRWTAWVQSGAEKFTIADGEWTVLPDLRASDVASPADLRSHARKVVDAIEAVIEKRATKDQMALTIAGRSLERTPIEDLLKLRQRYRHELSTEAAADRIAKGLGSGVGRIQVRI